MVFFRRWRWVLFRRGRIFGMLIPFADLKRCGAKFEARFLKKIVKKGIVRRSAAGRAVARLRLSASNLYVE